MNILIAGLVKNDQLKRLQEEGKKNGHNVEGCYAADLYIYSEKDKFTVKLVNNDIDKFDLIYVWTVGMRRWEWYTACLFLNKKNGTKIVNSKIIDSDYNYYLTPASEYLKQVESELPFPKSAVVFSEKGMNEVIDDFDFPMILKSSNGRQGKGVHLVNSKDEAIKLIKNLKDEAPSFVLREFIPNDGDIRIFTVGYKVVGAMHRKPTRDDEFRSNISQGGTGENYDIENYPEIKDIAEKISRLTRTEIAGVDIIIDKNTNNPYILEVNPGPQFLGIEKFTGINIAGKIIEYFERLLL